MARVLITNGSSHTPDNWAIATAEQIVQADPSLVGDRLLAAEKLKISIAEVLSPHHARVQTDERSKLSKSADYILSPHDAHDYIDEIIKDIVAAAKSTPWSAHFSKPEVQTAVRDVVLSHLQSSQHVERLWYADNNPDSHVAQSYKQLFQGT